MINASRISSLLTSLSTYSTLVNFSSSLRVITKRLSSCFLFKDKFPKSLLSGILYKYTCAKCKLCYIGCTKRFWEKRLEEHTHVSALTGNPLQGQQIFTPMSHARSCCPGRKISRQDFEVIGQEKDNYLLLLKESILISTSKPPLNGKKNKCAFKLVCAIVTS